MEVPFGFRSLRFWGWGDGGLRRGPEEEARDWAWEIRKGSWEAWVERTEERMGRKEGFSVKEDGVGGRDVVVPIAREGFGGVVGRRDKVWVEGERGEEWMY